MVPIADDATQLSAAMLPSVMRDENSGVPLPGGGVLIIAVLVALSPYLWLDSTPLPATVRVRSWTDNHAADVPFASKLNVAGVVDELLAFSSWISSRWSPRRDLIVVSNMASCSLKHDKKNTNKLNKEKQKVR